MLTPIADIFLILNGHILLVQHKKPQAYGLWGLPGGHVEKGESPETAILREVSEEVGIALDKSQLRHSLQHIERKSDAGGLEVTTFVAHLLEGPYALQAEELIGLGWFTMANLELIAGHLRSPWILPLASELTGLRQARTP